MRQSAESPVPADKRATFPPLPYYPIDEQYRVPAALKVGAQRPNHRALDVHRPAPQDAQDRHAAVHAEGPVADPDRVRRRRTTTLRRLFVPFGDLTNGTETYQGGRYLDLDRTAQRRLRPRLQPRLSPVLRLQCELRMSRSSAREPAEGPDPRRREAPRLMSSDRGHRLRLRRRARRTPNRFTCARIRQVLAGSGSRSTATTTSRATSASMTPGVRRDRPRATASSWTTGRSRR